MLSFSCLVLDEADRLLDMGYEKDVAAIVRAIVDHKKAATYDPLALMKQNMVKKIDETEETDETEKPDENTHSDIKHKLTEVFLSTERQTILLSATLTKVKVMIISIIVLNKLHQQLNKHFVVIYFKNLNIITIMKLYCFL